MARMIKRINKLQIICILGMLITLILMKCGINNMFNLFWIFVGASIGGNLLFLDKWGTEGLTRFKKMDKNYNKNYTRKSSDLLLFLLVAYVIIICIFFVVEFWIPTITQDLSVIESVTIFNILLCAIDLYIVDRTSKEVKETLRKGGNKYAK